MSRKSNIFWGLVFVVGAAAILLSRFGYLGGIVDGVGIWNILWDICLVAILLRGIINGSFGQILFSAAFLIIVNDKLLHLEAITPWPALGAAALGTIGLNMLFPNFGRYKKKHHLSIEMQNARKVKDGDLSAGGGGVVINYDNAFCSSVKYVTVEISQVNIDNAFGTTQVYFMDAKLEGGSAAVMVDTAFGNVVLYVPAGWTVSVNTENICASTKEQGRCCPDGENTLHVGGDIAFGSLEIVYV